MAIDVLIVGQGLAGTALAWACHAAGLNFQIIDRGNRESASALAAGMMSPVDGMLLAQSWRFAELLPRSLAFYREVEDRLGLPLIHHFHGWRLLQNAHEAADYQRKHREKSLAPFDQGPLEPALASRWLKLKHGGFTVSETHRLDVVRYLAASRALWIENDRLTEAEQMENDLVITEQGVEWRRQKYRTVVFCTGAALAKHTRLAGSLVAGAGVIGELAVESWPEHTVVQCGSWFVPIGEKRVAVGANRRNHATGPAEPGTQDLTHEADAILRIGWKIEAMRTGVRVAARDHGPVAGLLHPNGSSGVIGGLGANGALWSPWLARQWIAWWTNGTAFDPAVDVSRLPAKPRRTQD